jgi:hypothetical protein
VIESSAEEIEAEALVVARFGEIEITARDMKTLSGATIVERLVAGGASRLTAQRMLAIEQGNAEPGRARTHTTSRR